MSADDSQLHNADPIPADSDFENVRKAKQRFLIVGILLFCFTITTVAVATVPWLDIGKHGFDGWDAALGLLIASVKASLVALVFMHLNHEKKMIYLIFGLALFHGVGIFLGTYIHFADMPVDQNFYQGEPEEIAGDMGTDLKELRAGDN